LIIYMTISIKVANWLIRLRIRRSKYREKN
jgi:hypothetical protein